MCLLIAWSLATTISCKKDSLEDAVLPETVEGEQGSDGENGEDGLDGAQGEQGADGQAGEAGQDGTNGAQGPKGDPGATGPKGDTGAAGADGTEGTNGSDGQDGNANVKSFRFQTPNWTTVYSHLGIAMVTIPEINYEINNYSVILGYINFGASGTNTSGYILTPTSNQHISGYADTWAIDSKVFPGFPGFQFRLKKDDGSEIESLPPIYFAKVIIIEPSSPPTTVVGNGKRINSKQAIFNELKDAGVNINNYDEVARYYGMN